MKPDRRCFIQHFVLCLAYTAMAVEAWVQGSIQAIWQTDLSYMTSVVAGLMVFTCLYVGWQTWTLNPKSNAHFGLLVMSVCPLIGLYGTATGLQANIAALSSGASGLTPLGTSLVTMKVGVLGLILTTILVFNLEWGVRRHEGN
jgi:hypothetical protein